jgi:hypothetical protein
MRQSAAVHARPVTADPPASKLKWRFIRVLLVKGGKKKNAYH